MGKYLNRGNLMGMHKISIINEGLVFNIDQTYIDNISVEERALFILILIFERIINDSISKINLNLINIF
jgi:hypothetical protein